MLNGVVFSAGKKCPLQDLASGLFSYEHNSVNSFYFQEAH